MSPPPVSLVDESPAPKVLLTSFKKKTRLHAVPGREAEHLVPRRNRRWDSLAQPARRFAADLAVSLSSRLTHALLGRTDAKAKCFNVSNQRAASAWILDKGFCTALLSL